MKAGLLIALLKDHPEVGPDVQELYDNPSPSLHHRTQLGAALVAGVYSRDEDAGLQRARYTHMVSSTSAIERPLEPSDRSLNVTLFTREDLDNHPGLVSSVASHIVSPAQMKTLLTHLDGLAGDDTELRVRYANDAFTAANQLGKFKVMEQRYRNEKQVQADGGTHANHDYYRDLPNYRQLSTKLGRESNGLLSESFYAGYSMTNIFEHPWLVSEDVLALKPFPVDGAKTQQAAWLAESAFVQLEGFNKQSIGQIISNRLNNNLETSLHDATQWLAPFAVGENLKEVVNKKTGRTENLKEVVNTETGKTEGKLIDSPDDELRLLGALMKGDLSPDDLRRLPGFTTPGNSDEINLNKMEPLFHNPDHLVAYAGIIRALRKHTGESIDADMVAAEVEAAGDQIEQWMGRSKDVRTLAIIPAGQGVRDLLEHSAAALQPGDTPGQSIHALRQIGADRKAYVDGATTWLRRYQNISSENLGRAWNERAFALENGVEDTPTAIVEWSKTAAFTKFLRDQSDQEGRLRSGIDAKELAAKYGHFIPGMTSRYPSSDVLEALVWLHAEHSTAADLPPAQIDLGGGHSFRIIDKNTSAGFEIGRDTDCCMTWGGVSDSCIRTGYSDPRFGFAALYENDKLLAQSFTWHNQGSDGDTLVLDNIEAQRGHSVASIRGLYQKGLSLYLAKLAQETPDAQIISVNLGSGYTDSGIKTGLRQADPVDIPSTGKYIYSDAATQYELVRLTSADLTELQTPEALAAVKFEKGEPPTAPRDETAEFTAVDGSDTVLDIITSLERQVYPGSLRTGRNDLAEEIGHSENYSFTINRRTGNAEVVGYVLAYKQHTTDSVYVSDMAILPEAQGTGYGVEALEHLFGQVSDRGETSLVFEARESTSYRALQSASVQQLLVKCGFMIVATTRHDDHFDNGEAAYTVHLVAA